MFPYSRRVHQDAVPSAPALEVRDLIVAYPGARRLALKGVSICVPVGKQIALVGHNGAGKSTLLKAVAGLLPVRSGSITIYGNPPGACHHRVAYLPQRGEIDWRLPITLRKLVLTGRYVHLGWFNRPTRNDWRIADEVIDRLGLSDLRERQISQLSGGQQQRALLARVCTALGIAWLSRREAIREDTAIGVVFTGMFALGVLLMSQARSFRDFTHILFGNILGVTADDLTLIALITAGVLLLLFLFHKELELTSFDPIHAEVIGLKASWLRYLLLLLLALAVLLLITNWFFHKVYWTDHLASFHQRKGQLLRGEGGKIIGLLLLGFTSIYREGFETVLFLQTLVLDAGVGIVLQGVFLGLVGVSIVGVITFRMQTRLPYMSMMVVTGVLIGMVLVMLVGSTVRGMQVVAWLPVHPVDGLHLPHWLGQWFGVYPTWEGLLAQGGAAAFVIGSYYLAEYRSARARSRKANPLDLAVG